MFDGQNVKKKNSHDRRRREGEEEETKKKQRQSFCDYGGFKVRLVAADPVRCSAGSQEIQTLFFQEKKLIRVWRRRDKAVMVVNFAKDLGLAGASQWSAGYINHEHHEDRSARKNSFAAQRLCVEWEKMLINKYINKINLWLPSTLRSVSKRCQKERAASATPSGS